MENGQRWVLQCRFFGCFFFLRLGRRLSWVLSLLLGRRGRKRESQPLAWSQPYNDLMSSPSFLFLAQLQPATALLSLFISPLHPSKQVIRLRVFEVISNTDPDRTSPLTVGLLISPILSLIRTSFPTHLPYHLWAKLCLLHPSHHSSGKSGNLCVPYPKLCSSMEGGS